MVEHNLQFVVGGVDIWDMLLTEDAFLQTIPRDAADLVGDLR